MTFSLLTWFCRGRLGDSTDIYPAMQLAAPYPTSYVIDTELGEVALSLVDCLAGGSLAPTLAPHQDLLYALIEAPHGPNEKLVECLRRADIGSVERALACQPTGALRLNASSTQHTVMHEVGHFVEFGSRSVRRAARDFLAARRQNYFKKKLLRELLPGHGYKADEWAWVGNFIHPEFGPGLA